MWCYRHIPEHYLVRGAAVVIFLIGLLGAFAAFYSGDRIASIYVIFILAGIASLVAAFASHHPRWFLAGGIWCILLPFVLMQSLWFLLPAGILSLLLILSWWRGRHQAAPASEPLSSEQDHSYQEGYLAVHSPEMIQHKEPHSPAVSQEEQPRASYPEMLQ